ncbi:unnamed protein product [Peniophora sp. CBMAI 1063]|nr:unnamed protein product [Peniophora sp. CBMAI 1063]
MTTTPCHGGSDGSNSHTVPVATPAATQARRSPMMRKYIAHSLVEAVVDLHSKGIVHGDLHAGNVGLAIPALTDRHDKEYIRVCPDVTVVLPVQPAHAALSAHFPPYITHGWNFYNYIQAIGGKQVSPVVKIFDFGSAHLTNKPHPNSGFMYQIVPPECYIKGPGALETPNIASDIWALGLMAPTDRALPRRVVMPSD